MGKIISMTGAEIRKNFDVKKAIEMAKNAPEFDDDPNPGGVAVARGFAQFKEYINRRGRPKAAETLQGVYLRLPRDVVKKLRAHGRGWQTKFREKVGEMIRLGMI